MPGKRAPQNDGRLVPRRPSLRECYLSETGECFSVERDSDRGIHAPIFGRAERPGALQTGEKLAQGAVSHAQVAADRGL